METSRADYCHPYRPYDIQLEFMQNLYQSIEHGKVAIFESPTGTGKSLSLICGALTWLRDSARRNIEGSFNGGSDDDPDDWLIAAEKASRKQRFMRELVDAEERLLAIRRREAAQQEARSQANGTKKARIAGNLDQSQPNNDEDFMLDDYLSESENTTSVNSKHNLSSSTLALLDKLKPVIHEEAEQDEDRTKIIFCSRTHSQLTQFINEIRKVTPPTGLPLEEGHAGHNSAEIVKHLPLGSRKNLCINEKVSRLSSTLAINEKCLDLQKPGIAKEHKCQYLPAKQDKDRIETFRDHAIAKIRDIEDLGKLGKKMELCPYYAVRSAIPSGEILTLPYPLLLQKSAREALGVQVKGNVVIIDEAHNLMDAIADTLSMSLSLNQLDIVTKEVIAYVQRFKNKLKGSNRMYVTQLIRLLNSFTDCLRKMESEVKRGDRLVLATELVAGKGVDQLKPHKLLQYLLQSKLAHKVEGYIDAQDGSKSLNRPKGALLHFQNFLAILINPDSEGRFFASKDNTDIVIRYTLLDPREHFRDIVEQARAVILAGGTMSPMSDYSEYLFSYLDVGRLSTFSFGHVIPPGNMFVGIVTKSHTGMDFDFTFDKRNSKAMIVDLGNTILNICSAVPDGVVVFFPSYDYMSLVTGVWKQQTSGQPLMAILSAQKPIFEETRGASSESLLSEYSQAIDKGGGAILLSVIGGKLSEGINFSDKLGRAVIAVGLPFPNRNSAEWRAKIQHVETMRYQKCRNMDGLSEVESKNQANIAGGEFYENVCMRAINQSIGRAIRHQNDYAAIMLIDRRFATQRIQNKLPKWIQRSIKKDSLWSGKTTKRELEVFFETKTW